MSDQQASQCICGEPECRLWMEHDWIGSRATPKSSEAELLERYRKALEAIQKAVIEGRVCDDVAWFSNIETLHDFIEEVLHPSQPAAVADMFPAQGATHA